MLPISTEAHTVLASTGSNRICVTRVGPAFTFEAGITPGTVSDVQLLPASAERQKPAGRVPAISRSGLAGSIAIDHTSLSGDASSAQRAVGSSQRNTPMSVPANSRSGVAGWLANDQTRASRYMPEWLFGWTKLSPRSSL